MAFAKQLVLIVCVLSLWSSFDTTRGASSQAPTPTVDCSSLIMNLADCLSYVTNDSTISKPEGKCCSGLKSVLKTSPECLCEGFRSSAQLGVVLNVTKAIGLPAACRVSAPSVSNCGLNTLTGGAPGVAPSLAPSTATAGGPAASQGVTEQGMAPVPAPGNSGCAKLTISFAALVAAIAFACISGSF